MSTDITIRKADGTWVVRAGGAVLGESNNALELSEATLPPVIYFPRGDIAMAFLDSSDTRASKADLGDASYYSIQTKSETLKDAAWSFESPAQDAARIKDHIAFSATAKVTVEQL